MIATGLNPRQSTGSLRHSRSGAVLVAVLTCTFVSLALVAVAFNGSVTSRRQCPSELQRQQAAYLLQAGRLRAAGQVQHDPSYSGEVWDLTTAFSSYDLARVEITPKDSADSKKRRFGVVVHLGHASAPERTIQLSRSFLLPDSNQP